MIYYISNQKELESNDIYCIASIDDFKHWIKDKKEIQLDSETEGSKGNIPNPYTHLLYCIQIGDYDTQWVIDCGTVNIQFLKPYLEDPDIVKIFCNAFFDLRFLFHKGFNVKNVYDIFLVERSLTLGQEHPKGYLGLQGMCKRYLDVDLSKEVRGQIHWRGLDSRVIQYAALDVKYMEKIKALQLIRVDQDNLINCIRLENRFITTLARMAYNGFKLNPIKWLKIAEENKLLLTQYEDKLNNWLKDHGYNEYVDPQLDMFSEDRVYNLNWNSSQQVIKLFKKIGINTLTRDQEHSVEIKHLIKQKNKFDILPIYIKYKEVQKELSTYGEKFLKNHLNPISQRVHSEFFPILNTGRISSSNPNLQNISATTDVGEINPLRECFEAEESNTLVIADYSQAEPRITADYSQDPYLLNFIFNGDGDSHNLISTMISEYLIGEEIKVTKKNNPLVPKYGQKIRDIGKMINLGKDYGKTAWSIKDDLEITKEEAQKLLDLIDSKTPEKIKYFKKCIAFTYKHGYIIIDRFTNRRSYFKSYEQLKKLEEIPYEQKSKKQISSFYKLRGEMERFSQNFPIQGTNAGMTKLASILFEEEVQDKALIVNMVHDEIVVECKEENSKEISEILEKCMIKAGIYFCKTIPMKVDLFISKSWKK